MESAKASHASTAPTPRWHTPATDPLRPALLRPRQYQSSAQVYWRRDCVAKARYPLRQVLAYILRPNYLGRRKILPKTPARWSGSYRKDTNRPLLLRALPKEYIPSAFSIADIPNRLTTEMTHAALEVLPGAQRRCSTFSPGAAELGGRRASTDLVGGF